MDLLIVKQDAYRFPIETTRSAFSESISVLWAGFKDGSYQCKAGIYGHFSKICSDGLDSNTNRAIFLNPDHEVESLNISQTKAAHCVFNFEDLSNIMYPVNTTRTFSIDKKVRAMTAVDFFKHKIAYIGYSIHGDFRSDYTGVLRDEPYKKYFRVRGSNRERSWVASVASHFLHKG
ncbi:hypothetical protein JW877_00930 [bacterium]|nr:hypothetical protein [bacterium]